MSFACSLTSHWLTYFFLWTKVQKYDRLKFTKFMKSLIHFEGINCQFLHGKYEKKKNRKKINTLRGMYQWPALAGERVVNSSLPLHNLLVKVHFSLFHHFTHSLQGSFTNQNATWTRLNNTNLCLESKAKKMLLPASSGRHTASEGREFSVEKSPLWLLRSLNRTFCFIAFNLLPWLCFIRIMWRVLMCILVAKGWEL